MNKEIILQVRISKETNKEIKNRLEKMREQNLKLSKSELLRIFIEDGLHSKKTIKF